MKNFVKIGMFCLLSLVMGHLSAHAGTNPRAVGSSQGAGRAVEKVVVFVDNVPITHNELEAEFRREVEKKMPADRWRRVPEAIVRPYKERLRERVRDRMIEQRLLDRKVKEAKIVVSDEETDRELARRASAIRPSMSLKEYRAWVEKRGGNFDDLKKRVRRDLGYRKLFEKEFAAELVISDQDARKHYADQKRLFDRPEQVRVSHIVVDPKDFKSPGMDETTARKKALARAEELLKQIKAGADFDKLARENGAGSSQQKRGGDLGYIRKGQAPPDFEKAAFALKKGEVSGVLEMEKSYQIIKVTDRRPALSGFDSVKEKVKEDLKARRLTDLSAKYVRSLRKGAKIVYPEGQRPGSGQGPVPVKKGPGPSKTPVQSGEKPGSP